MYKWINRGVLTFRVSVYRFYVFAVSLLLIRCKKKEKEKQNFEDLRRCFAAGFSLSPFYFFIYPLIF